MVKLVYCIRRRSGMSAEEFRKHWRETHAPKVARFAEALHARRYVQSHTPWIRSLTRLCAGPGALAPRTTASRRSGGIPRTS